MGVMHNIKMTKSISCLWGLLKLVRLYGMRFEKQLQAMDEVIYKRRVAALVGSAKDVRCKNLTDAELFA
jgi:hypothetical protein